MNLNKTIIGAVADITLNGFSAARLLFWQNQIRRAIPGSKLTKDYLTRLFGNKLNRVVKKHARFTLGNVPPHLHSELNSRIVTSADLIKLNRETAINKTLQRFSGWASSIPPGGSNVVDKNAVKASIAKPINQLSFEERRVAIDQGHKLVSNIEEVMAVDAGALAGIWNNQGEHDASYDFRPDHMARAGKIYVVRGNWAMEKGLMKLAGHKYTDEITAPGEEVFCSCFYTWIYTLSKLQREAPEMVTEKFKNANSVR